MRKKKNQKLVQNLQKNLESANVDSLNRYLDMFDRMLLYNMAVNILPPEALETIMRNWEGSIKEIISIESNLRTEFMETTPQGRQAYTMNLPDGEEIRLNGLHTLKTAKNIVSMNLQSPHNSRDDGLTAI